MEDQFGDMQPVYHTEGPLNISRAVESEQRNIPRASGTCTCVLTGVKGTPLPASSQLKSFDACKETSSSSINLISL